LLGAHVGTVQKEHCSNDCKNRPHYVTWKIPQD
jgi:hypothetical protein